MNLLYYGDNLDILKRYVEDQSVDLVYLDPPFKSNPNYNVLFKEQNGSRAASQIRAFEDTWTWDQEDEAIFAELVTAGGRVADVMQAFRAFLGPCDMLAYLVMMCPRLLELRRTMKPTASIYLHCDPVASHYLKMLMDAVFEPGNFRNEIIWCYKRWPSKQDNFQQMHDVILRYSKSENVIWNRLYEDFTEQTKKRIKGGMKIKHIVGESGKILIRPTTEKSPGVAMCDYWNIPMIAGQAKERLGYPTQKPEALLERIIQASSNEGDLVLDPFCGCGTTVAVAQKLKRRWIGIDITHLAITLMKQRLKDAFGDSVQFQVMGEPVSMPDAAALAESDPYQFQWWALGLVGARPTEGKKGADKGIDGKVVFQGDEAGKFETVVISVKAGNTGAAHVRDLKGVLDREKAAIGVLISMQEPTSPMKTEAVTAGFFESQTWGRKYPKIQLLTVADLLAGKQIAMPPIKQVGATFKKAPKARGKTAETIKLPLPDDGE
jgi:DNA modification methylase